MGLTIVPYSPTDYSLSNVLITDAETTSDTISQVLSLYFQFKDDSKAFAVDPVYRGKLDLSYDEDERSPSELIITAQPELVLKLQNEKEMNIHVEVFETLYSFTSEILATYIDDSMIVVSVPKAVQKLSRRKYPRVSFPDDKREVLKFKISNYVVFPTHLGINSVEVIASDVIPDSGKIEINEQEFSYKVLRKYEQVYILGFHFENGLEFGSYFDLYRLVAYPSLRSRYEFSYEDGLKLFKDSGYFGKYNKEDDVEALRRITQTFESVKGDIHSAVADYYTVNGEGKLVGSSGVALSQVDENLIPFWCLQHMCALKDPASIENSGVLYAWRAEYLAGRPENLRFIVKFSYDSKWIQRIFHKFIGNSSSKSGSLYNTKTKWMEFAPCEETTSVSTCKEKISGNDRYFGAQKGLLVATEPVTLNFAGLLEEAIVFEEKTSFEELNNFVGSFLKKNGLSKRRLKVCYQSPGLLDSVEAEVSPSDGLCIVEKNAMYDFSKSIWHSIAVTKRKLQNAS